MPMITGLAWGSLILTADAQTTFVIEDSGYSGFADGEMEGVTLNDEGILSQGTSLEEVVSLGTATVWAAVPDGSGGIWLSVGNEPELVHIDAEGERRSLLVAGGIFARGLAVDANGVVYFGVSPGGLIYRFAPESERPEVFAKISPDYIWDMVVSGDRLLVASGEPASLIGVGLEDAEPELIFESTERHFTHLLVEEETIYLGTGDSGMVYRVDSSGAGRGFFLARESEISGLGMDSSGQLWVSTFEAASGSQEAAVQAALESSLGINRNDGNSNSRANGLSGSKSSGVLYRVTPEGFGLPVWKSDEGGILAMQNLADRYWLMGLEGEGRVFSVLGRDDWELLAIAKGGGDVVEFIEGSDRRLWVVTARPGKVYRLGGAGSSGVYTSNAQDCNQMVLFGMVEILGAANVAMVESRSGNTRIPDETWSDWAEVTSASIQNGVWRGQLQQPAARFFQYRIHLSETSNERGIERVRAFVQLPNVAPVLLNLVAIPEVMEAVTIPPNPRPVEYGALMKSGGKGNTDPPEDRIQFRPSSEKTGYTVVWNAMDPNQDELRYDLRLVSSAGRVPVLLEAGLEDPFAVVETNGLEEGYYRFELVARDPQGLTAQRSTRPVLVDNSGPVIQTLEGGEGFRIEVVDAWSVVEFVSMRIDGGTAVPLLPEDGLFDELRETFSIEPGLSGSVVFEARDERGRVSRLGIQR